MRKAKDEASYGEVYVWGQTSDGQLGNGSTDQQIVLEPIKLNISNNTKIIKLVCGAGHSLVLTQAHKLFSWGCNVLGQLGLGDTKNRNVPTEITSIKDRTIVDIASGAGHCMALDSYGVLYSWGASADFQTGHTIEPSAEVGDTKQFLIEPKRLDTLCLKGIQSSKIACGIKFTAILNTKNELICFGNNEFG